MRDAHILDFINRSAWAILPDTLTTIGHIVRAHVHGEVNVKGMSEALQHREARDTKRRSAARQKGVGVLPIHGTILPRGSELTETSGITTSEGIRSQLTAMVQDERIGSIVLDIDSPGGVVAGLTETAALIREAREVKPITAQVWDTAASAAYWLASQASEVVLTPSGNVGSIGILSMHVDVSRQVENEGKKVTMLTTAPKKIEKSPLAPLSEEAREYELALMNEEHDRFVSDISLGRGVTVDQVNKDFGQGRMLNASQAIKAGMADRIGMFGDTVRNAFDQANAARHAVQCEQRTNTLRLMRSRTSL